MCWLKGAPERKVFSALSPMTEGLSRIPDMPYAIKEQPTLTFVARQQGEAWNRPFVAVYEPSSVKEPGCISSVTFPEVESGVAGSHVGICIQQKEGRVDRIISSDDAGHLCKSGEMTVQAAYALWGNKQGDDNNSYNFEFARKDYTGSSYIRPKNFFYPCDGMPIRPCVYDTHSTSTL